MLMRLMDSRLRGNDGGSAGTTVIMRHKRLGKGKTAINAQITVAQITVAQITIARITIAQIAVAQITIPLGCRAKPALSSVRG